MLPADNTTVLECGFWGFVVQSFYVWNRRISNHVFTCLGAYLYEYDGVYKWPSYLCHAYVDTPEAFYLFLSHLYSQTCIHISSIVRLWWLVIAVTRNLSRVFFGQTWCSIYFGSTLYHLCLIQWENTVCTIIVKALVEQHIYLGCLWWANCAIWALDLTC